jgi:carbon-monoxide dehydrogenase medium subunit
VAETLDLLAQWEGRARIIAGGTDLVLELKEGRRSAACLVDVTHIPGLDEISLENGAIRLGPLVTHSRAVASSLLLEKAFPLPGACWQVGSTQIRNCATIAGNLVFASPAGDTIPPLWALGASVTLASRAGGLREVPFEEFFLGVQRTALQPDEMLLSIQFPALQSNERGTFLKLGLRQAQAIAVVNVAVILGFDGEIISRARIALGSVAPVIIRATEAEESLVGQPLVDEVITQAGELSMASARPIDDIRGSAAYRRAMVRVLTMRALRQLQEGTERQGWPDRRPSLSGIDDQGVPVQETSLITHQMPDDPLEFTLNGHPASVRGAHNKTLLQVLRQDLRLMGTKEGCAEGECGSCTILLDGEPVLSCLLPAMRAQGRSVTTIEGLAHNEENHPLVQAFVEEGAVQCGYCIPGFVVSARALLDRNPRPNGGEIREAITGNLCRCGNYAKIIEAIKVAAE